MSAEESKTLEMSFGESSLMDQRKKLDADELAILAAGLEGCHGELSHGDLVWAKVKGMLPQCLDVQFVLSGGLEWENHLPAHPKLHMFVCVEY